MADEKESESEDLDLGSGKSSKLKLIILIVAVLVLVGGGAAAYFLLTGEETPEGEQVEEEVVEEKLPAIYHALDPVFVVNLDGRPKLMQLGIQLRLRSPELDEFLTLNDPMIRHHILNILSIQEGKKLQADRAAKEQLQADLLTEVNKIVKDNDGPEEVEALFFTSFVLQ